MLKDHSSVKQMWHSLKVDRVSPKTLEWEPMYTNQEVMEYLLHWSVLHFGQSSDTPLMTGELKELLNQSFAGRVLKKKER